MRKNMTREERKLHRWTIANIVAWSLVLVAVIVRLVWL